MSALQMLNLENIAASEIGLTENMMTENSGRGIAEVIVAALGSDPAVKMRLGLTGVSASAVTTAAMVVCLVGNNKSGIRALAAARHLANKGVHVAVCVVGIERERSLLEDLKQQIRIYRQFGGQVYNKHELFNMLQQQQQQRGDYSSSLASAAGRFVVSLIVDALFGLTVAFEELRTGDQAAVYELMEWSNRSEAYVLAVDVPTGIDPSSGRVSLIDGSYMYIRPRWVVAVGAPKRGLVEAISAAHDRADAAKAVGSTTTAAPAATDGIGTAAVGINTNAAGHDGVATMDSAEDEWKLYVVDMGLGSSVWRKAGTRFRKGVDFGDKWWLEMQWQTGGDDGDL